MTGTVLISKSKVKGNTIREKEDKGKSVGESRKYSERELGKEDKDELARVGGGIKAGEDMPENAE